MKEHKAVIIDATVTGDHGDEEVVLNKVTILSKHVAMQQTTVTKTKNDFAHEAVQLR